MLNGVIVGEDKDSGRVRLQEQGIYVEGVEYLCEEGDDVVEVDIEEYGGVSSLGGDGTGI